MPRSFIVAVLAPCLGLLLVAGTPSTAQPPPVKNAPDTELVEKVKNSIDKGVRYLKKHQGKEGDWEGFALGTILDFKGGVTSLATLALLNAGLKADDPSVAKALQYLETIEPAKTYVRALQTMALAEARDKRYLPKIAKNVEWLEKNAIRSGDKLEGWSYPGNQIADNSNTQYALLGLYAAKTAGATVDDKLWKEIEDYYSRTQKGNKPNGYWSYYTQRDTKASFSMTVAGACGLLIAKMALGTSEQQLNEQTGIAANCGHYAEDSALARSMFWIGSNFNFLDGKSYFYNFYGIERLGRLSGQRFIGRHDWYREGCERLVRMQEVDGSFVTPAEFGKTGIDAGQPIITTSFALLFLSKGRTPVLISKFAWGKFRKASDVGATRAVLTELDPAGQETTRLNWNRKHNDCRNVVEFAAREIFDNAPLSWQVYDPRLQDLTTLPKINDEVGLLLQSPIVYLNGHGPMPFVGRATEQLSTEELILQKYVEEGGFLLAEACCGDADFTASFESLVERLFPGSKLERMPPEHAIWTMYPGVNPADFPDLRYVSRGCRTIAVFSPSPLAGYWEEARFIPQNPRAPKNRGEKAFCLARNIIAYATGLELPKPKLTRTVLPSGEDKGVARSKFRPLQLKYSINAQDEPAPGALRNLLAFLEQSAQLDVTTTSRVLSPGDINVSKYKFMYLHGRAPIAFTPDEMDNIKANLQSGGLLLADASCNEFKAWQEFDKSFRESMKKMWGKDLEVIRLRVNDANEPFFQIANEAGINLQSVRCRRENADSTGPEKEMRTYPVYLEGIKVDDRWVVIYSKYDIGCAIEGHKSAHCLGYDKDSALRIAAAAVLYSLKR